MRIDRGDGATDADVNEHREVTARPRAVLLDIEGTTTPLAFVTHVLFPYVRQHLRSHLDSHAHAPEYHALNPQNALPLLDHDGLRITQSLAIMEYIEETWPQATA